MFRTRLCKTRVPSRYCRCSVLMWHYSHLKLNFWKLEFFVNGSLFWQIRVLCNFFVVVWDLVLWKSSSMLKKKLYIYIYIYIARNLCRKRSWKQNTRLLMQKVMFESRHPLDSSYRWSEFIVFVHFNHVLFFCFRQARCIASNAAKTTLKTNWFL